jgi:hypothetical protein
MVWPNTCKFKKLTYWHTKTIWHSLIFPFRKPYDFSNANVQFYLRIYYSFKLDIKAKCFHDENVVGKQYASLAYFTVHLAKVIQFILNY